MTTECWLLDGAMLRGSKILSEVAASQSAVHLYGDMGADAGAIGPWLVDASFAIDARVLPLPMRLGISKWAVDGGIDELLDHADAIRHLRTDDGQVFYFRYADTRVLKAVMKALPPGMHKAIHGPLRRWTWLDRRMEDREFLSAAAAQLPTQDLKLTTRQFEALLAEGLPDRLALALEELNEPELGAVQLPEAFSAIRAAADYLAQRQIESFALQRAVARQAVLTKCTALQDDGFRAAVTAACQGAPMDAVDCWRAEDAAATAANAMKP
jgi:Domain of unknown function (DUF4123)